MKVSSTPLRRSRDGRLLRVGARSFLRFGHRQARATVTVTRTAGLQFLTSDELARCTALRQEARTRRGSQSMYILYSGVSRMRVCSLSSPQKEGGLQQSDSPPPACVVTSNVVNASARWPIDRGEARRPPQESPTRHGPARRRSAGRGLSCLSSDSCSGGARLLCTLFSSKSSRRLTACHACVAQDSMFGTDK